MHAAGTAPSAPTSVIEHLVSQSCICSRSCGIHCTWATDVYRTLGLQSFLLISSKASGCNACKGCTQGQTGPQVSHCYSWIPRCDLVGCSSHKYPSHVVQQDRLPKGSHPRTTNNTGPSFHPSVTTFQLGLPSQSTFLAL